MNHTFAHYSSVLALLTLTTLLGAGCVTPVVPGSTAADLVFTGSLPTYGGVTIGTTKDLSFTVSNTGASDATLTPLTSTSLALSAPYSLVGGTCVPGMVLHGSSADSCTLAVRFTPALEAHVSQNLLLSYQDVTLTGAANAKLTLDGFGVLDCLNHYQPACPVLTPVFSISDGVNFDYKGVAIGSTADHTFTISNTGRAVGTFGDLSTAGLGLAAPFTAVGGTCITSGTLAALTGTCTLIVRYTPMTLDSPTATITVAYSGSGAFSTSRAIQGTGVLDCNAFPQPQCPVLAPSLAISAGPTLDFGSLAIGATADFTFTVTNTGPGDGFLGTLTTSGLSLAAPFTLVGGTCTSGATISASVGACTIIVRFTPTAAVTSNDSIDLKYTDATTSFDATRPITGTGFLDCVNFPQPQCPKATPTGVYTRHYDLARTGANLSETLLTPANVNTSTFGKLFSYAVDGQVYAQPLYAPGLNMPNVGIKNVVFVATQHDSVYAFDADNVGTGAPLWQDSFINPAAGITSVPSVDTGTTDIMPEVGITGTPVIDPNTNTLYVVAKTKENGVYFHRLHALDLLTGNERTGSPVVVTATYLGTGDGNDGAGNIPFNQLTQNQRPALTLSKGIIYIGFASHGDNPPYHGWLLGYDATSLSQVAVVNLTPDGGEGSIWMSGMAPSVDSSGNLYMSSGNGTFDISSTNVNYGDSIVKLTPGSGLGRATGFSAIDSFTPFNQAALNEFDIDLGSGGVMVIPDQVGAQFPRLAIQGGKAGTLYLLNRDNLGGFNATDNFGVVQELDGAVGGVYSTPAYWQGTLYFHSASDVLKSFHFVNGKLPATPTAKGLVSYGFPGATPAISANGTTAGIVWDVDQSGFNKNAAGVLHAYDASNVAVELYNSSQATGGRDTSGLAVKFASPVVTNGKVYVGGSASLTVFGLF